MQILVATNNPSKLVRLRSVLAGMDVTFFSPADLGIPAIETEEGSDLKENAEQKAKAYFGKTDLPILGMDTALVIPGEELDPAKVRRNALVGKDESTMTREEIAAAMIEFYQALVVRRGGNVPAYWEDVSVLVLPDGTVKSERDMRPIILTGEVKGTVDPHLPIRSLYIVEATGKRVFEQTPEEVVIELKPYTDAMKRLIGV